jgi:hypothetical protein
MAKGNDQERRGELDSTMASKNKTEIVSRSKQKSEWQSRLKAGRTLPNFTHCLKFLE